MSLHLPLNLHGYWRSSTSYRTRIALALKGLDFDYTAVDLGVGEQRGATYKAVNPHGTVPTLHTPDGAMTQSLGILDWLEATHPTPSFLPTRDILLCRDLFYAIATEIHAPLNPSVLKRLFENDRAAKEKFYQFIVHRTFAPVETRLAAHDWHTAELPFRQPTLFEIVLVPQLYNARRWNVDLTDFPLLRKIDDHCQTRDAFIQALPENQTDATPSPA